MSTDKKYPSLRDQCSINHITLIASSDDRGQPIYIATRWGLSRTFVALEDVHHWLSRVTGRPVADAEFELFSMQTILAGDCVSPALRH